MRRRLVAFVLAAAASVVHAIAIEPPTALAFSGDDTLPLPVTDTRWAEVPLPDARAAPIGWYRVAFDAGDVGDGASWMLYVPYLYGGGRIWLNGEVIAAVAQSDDTRQVRWERPMLFPLPASVLRDGANVLHFRVAAAHAPSNTVLARIVVGTQDELQPQFDRRLFFVRTMPVITIVVAFIAGLFTLFIWSQRRHETLYALAGLSAILWGIRTLTFVFDSMPASVWPLWRLLYQTSNGGFVVVQCLYGLHLARSSNKTTTRLLLGYLALGPLLYLAAPSWPQAEAWVGRRWVAGLIPIGIAAVVFAVYAAWKRRLWGVTAIATAMSLTLVAGVHDYLVAWRSPLIELIAPGWAGHRFFLLHYGADVLLLTLGLLLTQRFLRSLGRLEEVNRTLEARVAEREREIEASYAQIAELQREQATTDERQRIMRDLHDGLGSTLFTSLSRAERGALPPAAMADALRASIDEMRIAIEALASDERDFRTAFGNFRFRWDARLREAGLLPSWTVELPDAVLALPPHDALQLLHIVQEALTNVLKHARAQHVHVRLTQQEGRLCFEVEDDGPGADLPATTSGRGRANMQTRAQQLGAQLDFGRGEHGFRVRLDLSLR